MKGMQQKIKPPDDTFQIRCPRLGHQIYFSYCRRENSGLPCFKTLDCWHVYFPVMEFLQQELSSDEWRKAFEKPAKPKILSLLEILDQVQKNAAQKK
jgi:hypothetical protein